MDITTLIVTVLGAAVIGSLLTVGVQKFIQWKAEQNGLSKEFIEALVEVAEKMYEGEGRGKEKLAWVLGVLNSEAEKINVTFDVEKVTEIINAYVEDVFNAPGVGEDEVQ